MSLKTGELASKLAPELAVRSGEASDSRAHFMQSPGKYSAIDFLGVLRTLAQADPLAARAEEYLAREPLAFSPRELLQTSDTASALHDEIRRLRASLRAVPRNPRGWTDLALAFLSLGQSNAAQRAMLVALDLARGDRHTLRAASRLYVHLGDPEHAVDLLRSSGRLDEDPWILAPAIAAAQLADEGINFSRGARNLLADDNWSDRARSELASQFGTLELRAGRVRQGKALMGQSLRDPNDNALAQAVWASKLGVAVEPHLVRETELAYEAQARTAAAEWDWEAAIVAAMRWLRDQPFSTSPGAFVGWVAAMADSHYTEAVEAMRHSLQANPTDATLANNLAFCLASLGEFDAARDMLRAPHVFTDDKEGEVLEATWGYLAFREGAVESGRAHYQRAIDNLARAGQHGDAEAARLFWLLEEVRVNPSAGQQLRGFFEGRPKGSSAIEFLRERLKRAVGIEEP